MFAKTLYVGVFLASALIWGLITTDILLSSTFHIHIFSPATTGVSFIVKLAAYSVSLLIMLYCYGLLRKALKKV